MGHFSRAAGGESGLVINLLLNDGKEWVLRQGVWCCWDWLALSGTYGRLIPTMRKREDGHLPTMGVAASLLRVWLRRGGVVVAHYQPQSPVKLLAVIFTTPSGVTVTWNKALSR